jgi:transcriptional regulator with XRE-family HTH domain
MDVGKEIRRLREEKGWSQAKLAGETGMGVSSVSQIETGVRNPSAATLWKIAAALDVEMADLFPKAQSPLPLDYESSEPRRALANGQSELDQAAAEAFRASVERAMDYQYWLDFVNRYADDWDRRLETGDFKLTSLEEFDRLTDALGPTLRKLEEAERRELPQDQWGDAHENLKMNLAMGRLLGLLNPMLAAAAEKFPRELLGDELEPLRRKRDERLRELRRGA